MPAHVLLMAILILRSSYELAVGRDAILEPLFFNSSYAVALLALQDSLLSEGTVLQLHACEGASFFGTGQEFDASPMFNASDCTVPVLDAAFVDDEVIAILARSACQLDKSVTIMLRHIVRICHKWR